MKVIEKELALEEAIKIFDTIEETIKENRNTQVFVEYEIIKSLIESNVVKCETYSNVAPDGSCQYYHTYFNIYYKDGMYTEISFVARGHRIMGRYAQLLTVSFVYLEEYIYSEVGFEQLLKIDIKK